MQEKKAHENWVAARQAERKLTDLQVRGGRVEKEGRERVCARERERDTETETLFSEIQDILSRLFQIFEKKKNLV